MAKYTIYNIHRESLCVARRLQTVFETRGNHRLNMDGKKTVLIKDL